MWYKIYDDDNLWWNDDYAKGDEDNFKFSFDKKTMYGWRSKKLLTLTDDQIELIKQDYEKHHGIRAEMVLGNIQYLKEHNKN